MSLEELDVEPQAEVTPMGLLNNPGDKVHIGAEVHYFPQGLNMVGTVQINGQNGGWVQLTQAQYDALGTKDPNTLYLIVG